MHPMDNGLLERFAESDILYTESAIQERVANIARQISEDYRDCNPVLVSVLRGGTVFLADLMRALEISHAIDFIAT